MSRSVRLIVEGVPPIGEDLWAKTIKHKKDKLDGVELTVSMETLKEWQDKINRIIKRHDKEKWL